MVVGQFVAELAPATIDEERSGEAQPAQMLVVPSGHLERVRGDVRSSSAASISGSATETPATRREE
jgi:hypothetical protein